MRQRIRVAQLNQRFQHRLVTISDMGGIAVMCWKFVKVSSWIEFQAKDGRDWHFIPVRLTKNSVEGFLPGPGEKKVTIELCTSVQKTLFHKERLEHMANRIWRDLALRLSARIPKLFLPFASQCNWIRSEDPKQYDAWQMPQCLDEWVRTTKKDGYAMRMEFRNEWLPEQNTGFANCS